MKQSKARSTVFISLGISLGIAAALLVMIAGAARAARRQQASSSGLPSSDTSSSSAQQQDSMKDMTRMHDMPGMNMDHGKQSGGGQGDAEAENDQHTQSDAMHSMQMGQSHHMHMT